MNLYRDNEFNIAKKLHYASLVVDTHNDTMMKVINPITWLPKNNLGANTGFQIDLPKLRAGGLKVVFFSAFTSGFARNSFQRSNSIILALLNALQWTADNNKDSLQIATNHSSILDITKDGRIAAIPTIEGAYSLNASNAIELLRQYYDLGVRGIALQWNYSNPLGEGASKKYKNGKPSSGGLTELGRSVVKEMNRLGMMVDVSHMAEETFWDVIETSTAPIIASHSGVYCIKKHPRNLTDQQLKSLAAKGGVIQIVFFPGFLSDGEASISTIVDHIDYVVELVGVDYVGLGSDFDGARMPKDLPDASYVYRITEELVIRGYSASEIEGILGKNSLRLLKKVEELSENQIKADKDIMTPSFCSGDRLQGDTPLLEAAVKLPTGTELNPDSIRVILDGIAYNGFYDSSNKIIHYKPTEPLKERFHVVTFEATDTLGNSFRNTSIFYINRNWLLKQSS